MSFYSMPEGAMRYKTVLVFILAFLLVILVASLAMASAEGGSYFDYNRSHWIDFGKRVMNFVVFFLILFFLLRKPIKAFFQGKKENIARTLEYLETQASNLEEQNQVMRKQLSSLAAEREAIIAQYEKDGARERERIIVEAHKTAEAIIRKAESAMEQEIKIAKRALARQTGLLATQFAAELLEKNITDDDKNRAMMEFVTNITKLPAQHS
jgi:F-type H+-transporting ATPase subunit b